MVQAFPLQRTDNYRDNNAFKQTQFSGGLQWYDTNGRAVLDVERQRQLDRGRARRIRDRHDHVDLAFRDLALDLLGQVLAHFQAGGIHRCAVENGIGTGQVDVFERTRVKRRVVGALARMHDTVVIDENGRIPGR